MSGAYQYFHLPFQNVQEVIILLHFEVQLNSIAFPNNYCY